jgi:hypothetical protein
MSYVGGAFLHCFLLLSALRAYAICAQRPSPAAALSKHNVQALNTSTPHTHLHIYKQDVCVLLPQVVGGKGMGRGRVASSKEASKQPLRMRVRLLPSPVCASASTRFATLPPAIH